MASQVEWETICSGDYRAKATDTRIARPCSRGIAYLLRRSKRNSKRDPRLPEQEQG